MQIIVAKDGTGDYDKVQAAIDAAVPGDVITIKKGIYKERIELKKSGITIEGEDAFETVITEGYYALMMMDDGVKRGTFRSYTALFNADDITVKNLTIENSAGFGTQVGQAVAVYAEGDNLHFDGCRFLGHQDTLFTGPLPKKEKEPGGFRGPTEHAKRRVGRQLYEHCYICGEVDFIFGSATAYFYDCELYALDRGRDINAYYTAPSTYEGEKYGYVFENCRFTGNCPKGTAVLSRPWREHAKAVFINCDMDENVSGAGFDDWNKPVAHETAFYAEYACSGAGFTPEKRVDFAHILSDEEAAMYTRDKVLAPRSTAIEYRENELDVNNYLRLRSLVGWKELTGEQAQKALDNSLFVVAAYMDGKPVGMGRIVGDGAVISYVQDLIVVPDVQGRGVGSTILNRLTEYVESITSEGTEMMFDLMCAKGREDFYRKHGFMARPTDKLGPGMIQYINKK